MTIDHPTITVPLRTDPDGSIRIGNTRVHLHIVIRAYEMGDTAEGIVDKFPTLKLEDVHAVLSYYLTHRAEVDAYMRQIDEQAERNRQITEANYTPEQRALHERIRTLRDKEKRQIS
jgi:uncharacterized protein (DUF433 family)